MDDRSWIGATALYRSVSMVEQKPRVGGEPSKAFIWDVDLNITTEVPFFTTLANAVPLVSSTTKSDFTLSAEYAVINANPNTYGEAYIDDFEGVRDIMDLGIRRTSWTTGSAPFDYSQATM
jgi:cell surface protein SprA